ncbi:lytic transglycosylase domain-containing protein [Curtobacterium sp. MCBA15_004]|uniref:coiled-coil domain-containing protein n=1 Tax=unclassified Curtobacterium TaxID=257496 RepID=UPI0008DDB3D2|nr:lytic transglycosylase domain-containing protein [Curtobacterium sp. MCBA15_004]WIA97912.1 lytic transglycosylase domain-containing protein [Curtobacterium sp. MCBA15_004]
MRSSPSRAVLVAVALVAGALVAPVVTAVPASATTYPSWQDVEAAKGNEQAKQAEVATIQDALHAAQADAATKSQAALDASAAADRAEADLTVATQTATSLQAQATEAQQTADRAKTRAGQLAASLYRDGNQGAMTSRIASAHDPDELLYQLGALDQLTGTWTDVLDDASVAAHTASSLHEQALRAEDERTALAAAAEQKSDAAASASDAAQQAVDSTQQHSDELYAQLAALKDTTAATEQQYAVGQAVAAQAAAQARAAQAAALAEQARQAAGSSGSSASSGGGNAYPSTDGVAVDPAGAKAYAQSRLGSYGWGSDQYSCLVSLWTQESGWRANALNASSGAYGIPQALPANKMSVAGADWRTNAATQVDWGLAYIRDAYGSPCGAWHHEMSVNPHWY